MPVRKVGYCSNRGHGPLLQNINTEIILMSIPDKTLETTKKSKAPKSIASTQSLSSFVKAICDVMRRSNCVSALQYVPELTWILFLRILDAQEQKAREEAEALGNDYSPALSAPYR